MKNKVFYFFLYCTLLLSLCSNNVFGQTLSLDDCINLALQNNKQLKIASLQKDIAQNTQKSARTKYLPKVDAIAGYELMSREVSLLSNSQKNMLNSLGQSVSRNFSSNISDVIQTLVGDGLISNDAAEALSNRLADLNEPLTDGGDRIGNRIADLFHTDTRQIWAGSIMLRQPIYMGGAISAYNKIADIGIEMAENTANLRTEQAIFDIEQTYWLVVSLRQKQKLAYSYRDLIAKLNQDVHKMIEEGVATRADGLKVEVKLGEAEVQTVQVDDGLVLSKMLLCQLCGLPMDSEISLVDEDFKENGSAFAKQTTDASPSNSTFTERTELQLLRNTIDLSTQSQRLATAAYRPQIALTGGYLLSNPNVFNGFERKFKGVWNIGLLVRVPLWSWNEAHYKAQAMKNATEIARHELSEATEKIQLQTTQCRFKLNEAYKKYEITRKNIESAEENLRCADIGFQEGVLEATDVMAAQTAWQQAKTNHIDAQIDIKMAELNLRKAEGKILNQNPL